MTKASDHITTPRPYDEVETGLIRRGDGLLPIVGHAASIEELKASNEELQAMNEGLKSNLDKLSRSNNDLQNLMAATEIATIFLDRELRMQRFTPSAKTLFNFIPTDLGRSLADLKHHLDYPEIVTDVERSLAHLQPIEREVKAGEQWYLARTLPYSTADNHIAGVVLTFLNITTLRESENALRASETKFRALAESIPLFGVDGETRRPHLLVQPPLVRLYRHDPGTDGRVGMAKGPRPCRTAEGVDTLECVHRQRRAI